MKRYDPEQFKEKENISMEDIELFYTTARFWKKEGDYITMIAPLLVCMALHEKKEEISYLLEKYPLVNNEGWTLELEENQRAKQRTILLRTNIYSGNSSTSKLDDKEQLTISCIQTLLEQREDK
jgi:hypothetical protein